MQSYWRSWWSEVTSSVDWLVLQSDCFISERLSTQPQSKNLKQRLAQLDLACVDSTFCLHFVCVKPHTKLLRRKVEAKGFVITHKGVRAVIEHRPHQWAANTVHWSAGDFTARELWPDALLVYPPHWQHKAHSPLLSQINCHNLTCVHGQGRWQTRKLFLPEFFCGLHPSVDSRSSGLLDPLLGFDHSELVPDHVLPFWDLQLKGASCGQVVFDDDHVTTERLHAKVTQEHP